MNPFTCPSDIEVLLWCHVRPEPHESHERLEAPAVHRAICCFLDQGLIYPVPEHPGVYHTTKRGQALIVMLLRTPLPVADSVWRDPRDNSVALP